MNIKGKKILVTGGGSGIGLAIAKHLKEEGSEVIVTGRNKQKLESAAEANGLVPKVCDVTNDVQIKTLLDELNATEGIDVLINNAGVFENVDYTAESQSLESQEREIAIDFFGPIKMTNYFLPMLKSKSEAAIVNVSSGLGFVALAQAPVYSATKSGLHSWTQSLRHQLRNSEIKVFELMPPLVETEMVANFKGQPMMKPEKLASDFVKGFKNNDFEITPGQSSQLKFMSRLAPGFIFKMLNKQMEK